MFLETDRNLSMIVNLREYNLIVLAEINTKNNDKNIKTLASTSIAI